MVILSFEFRECQFKIQHSIFIIDSSNVTFSFEIIKKDPGSSARLGRLVTAHGEVETPAFMAVGTQATVKAMTPRDLEEAGCRIVLGNTYHLYLRPSVEVIRALGGLHRFMGWNGPILTDSGGF